jgi:hypothetical protein
MRSLFVLKVGSDGTMWVGRRSMLAFGFRL